MSPNVKQMPKEKEEANKKPDITGTIIMLWNLSAHMFYPDI